MNIALPSLLCVAMMAVPVSAALAAGNGKEARPAGVGQLPSGAALSEMFRIEFRQGRVLLHLKLYNRSLRPIRVAREFAAEEELERGLFDVRDLDTGAAVAYTGMLVKRSAPTLSDYVVVKPGQVRNNTIEISRSYVFEPGHTYRLSHQPGYLVEGSHPEQPLAAETVHVEFRR